VDDRRGPWENALQAWARLQGWVSAAHADGGVPALEALDDIGEVRRVLGRAELEAVRTARRHGRSWAEIATRLGVTRQSAWERWRDLEEPVPEPTPEAVDEALPLSLVVDDMLGSAARELRRRATVTVPGVVGMSYHRAREVLRDKALIAVVPDPDAAPAVGGTVTDQSPEAGAKVPAGSRVTLWVERGGGSGVREPRRPGPDPRHAREHAPEPTADERAVG
jgi:PASTA domain